MKRTGFIFTVILALIVLAACYVPMDCVSGKGEMVEQSIELGTFERIKLKSSCTVYLNKSSEQKVIVKGQQNLIDLINTSIKDDTWEIQFEKCVRNIGKFEVHINLPSVSEASIYGSGDIIGGDDGFISENLELNIFGSGDIKMKTITKNLSSNIKGSGDIKITGSAMKYDIDIAGSGEISAVELQCKRVDIDIKGSGDVRVAVEEKLDVDILGSGDVYYKGNPGEVDKDIKGSGNVKSLK